MAEKDAPVVEDGWYSNHRIVVFNPTEVAAESLASAALGAAQHSGVNTLEYEELQSASREVAVVSVEGGLSLTLERPLPGALGTLAYLERKNSLVAATPLRSSASGTRDLSEIIAAGSGQIFVAGVEALRGDSRPDADILGGSILLEFDSPASAQEAHEALAADRELVALVERVPARWLEQAVPAETELPMAPWHLHRIGVEQIREIQRSDRMAEVEVAVLDSGIDESHSYLKDQIATYSYAPPRPGLRSDRRDIIGHGTHVAGIIAANGPIGNVEGVSRCRLHPYKVMVDHVDKVVQSFGSDGQPQMLNIRYINPVMYLRALQDCADSDFPVINLSLSGSREGSSDEKRLFKRFVDQGQIVVAAMGNARRHNSPPRWPAKYPSVVAVGALDFNDQVARYSNSGDHISICAPGVDILSTMPTYRGVESFTAKLDENGSWVRDKELHWVTFRGNMTGTSMATPQVAGAAALWTAKNGRDAPGFVSQLQQSARKLSLMQGETFTPDYGYGCLNLRTLLNGDGNE